MTDEEVVRLPVSPPEQPEEPPTPPTRLHGIAIVVMAVSALAGIGLMFAFVTVSWPEGVARLLRVAFAGSVVAFIASASAAVLTAARDTYAARR